MRLCIDHTNLGKNAKSHNYSRQIALIQYSEPYEASLRVAGRGSKVAVAGPMSRSRVQSCGRGSNVAAGENDLEFEVTE